MKKVRITESQLKGLVRRMIKEEMENRSYGGYDPMDDEPPFGGSEGTFREKNPPINVKGLPITDAIKKIKSEIYPLKVLSVDTLGDETIVLKTFIDRYAGVSEGYMFYYKNNSNYKPSFDYYDPSVKAISDARFEQFEFD